MNDDADRRADGQHGVADAREKPRRVRRVVAVSSRFGSLEPFLPAAAAMTPNPVAPPVCCAAMEDYTTVGGEALCEGRHTCASIAASCEVASQRGAMIDEKRARVRRTARRTRGGD